MAPDLRESLLAALAWQVELGADEAIGEHPVDRFAVQAEAARAPSPMETPATPAPVTSVSRAATGSAPTAPATPAPSAPGVDDAAREACVIAQGCPDLPSLAAALAAFEGCALKAGARNCVFADGLPGARVMIVGEAPGREEDLEGRPFVGRSGQLLDRMLAAIGLDRRSDDPARAVYIANMLPWRPVGNRTPSRDETAMLEPFVLRHIALAAPEFLVLTGAVSARALLGTEVGITKLRGRWGRAVGRLALPMLHPAYLLRNPAAKRMAWRDLLSLRAALDGAPPQVD